MSRFRRNALGQLYDHVRATRVLMSLKRIERPLGGDVYVAVFFVGGQDTGLVQPSEAQVGVCGQQVCEDLGKEILESRGATVEAKQPREQAQRFLPLVSLASATNEC